jgi:hypothetical protein
LLLVALVTDGGARAAEADFFVAPGGNDSASGRKAEPDGQGGGPWATLGRARDAVRQLKADGPLNRPVTVMLRGGTYVLAETFVLGPQDSGTEGAPITYAAYPGEKPILSGGRRITGWERGEGELWKVHLPQVEVGEWHFRQLFVNNQRRPRARTPNEGWFHLTGLVNPKNRKDPINRKAFRFRPGDLRADWTNLHHVEIVKLFGWSETRLPIASVDEEQHVCVCAGLCSGSYRRLFDWYGPRYFVENVFEGLDRPGEWYLDRRTGVLYYWPMPGEEIDDIEVVAPVLDCLVRLDGDAGAGNPIEHVTFRGLTFIHGGAAFPEGGYREAQSDVFVPGAVRGTGVCHCRFLGNEIAHVGTYAIELAAGSQHNEVVGNWLHDLGGGGVKIDGPRDPESDAHETSHILITDNRVHDAGHIYFGGTGIWAGHSGHNTISHNEVHDLYGMGISIGWTWAFRLTPAHHNLVEYNHVYDLGHGKVGASSGLYTLARQPGTKVRYNLVHDIVRYTDGPTHPTFGIQVDNGSGEILFEKNVVYNVPDACWKQMGKLHTVRNNVFAFADGYEILRRKDQGSLVFRHNIVLSDDGQIFGDSWDEPNFEADQNLYWDTSDEALDFGGVPFDQWQARGHDAHSVVADPGFAAPEKGDFRLPPGSPALEIGFEPIDLSDVGPRGGCP